ncbi:MAG TPA: glycosyltransferase family 39 protein [Solirubrobacteraceae bacterium]|nr:glycosyltransferase family 39 protein [Solirubrobacteraceae bacterium]
MRATWAILIVALAVRLAAIAAHPDYVPVGDPADYERIALSVSDGHYPGRTGGLPGPTAYRPPLYPIALGVAYGLAPVEERTWARIAQALVGTLTVGLVGLVAWLALRRRRVALIAMGLAAVWPPMWLYGSALLTEVVFVPITLAAVASALRWRETRARRWVVACGVLVGLAALTRANGIALAAPLAVALWDRAERPLLRRALPAVAMVGVMALTIAPWTIRNAIVFERFVPIAVEDGYGLAGTYNDEARAQERFPGAWINWYEVPSNVRAIRRVENDEVVWNDTLREKGLDYVAEHPGYVAKVAWWNLRRIFDAAGLEWLRFEFTAYSLPGWAARLELLAFWPVALLALGGLATRAARAAPRWLALVPAAFLLPIFVVGYARFRAPIDPFLAILAACALSAAAQRVVEGRR